MKVEVKELKKAIDTLTKNGNLEVTVTIDDLGTTKLKLSSYSDITGHIIITLFSTESAKKAEITKTETL